MSTCVIVDASGSSEVATLTETQIASLLGNTVSIVGAIDELQVVVVSSSPSDTPHVWAEPLSAVLCEIPGDTLVFVASDVNGDAMDVDVEALRGVLRAYGLQVS